MAYGPNEKIATKRAEALRTKFDALVPDLNFSVGSEVATKSAKPNAMDVNVNLQ